MENHEEKISPELKELIKRGEQKTFDDFRDIMGSNMSDQEITGMIERIDHLTQDDASTYELNALLIERDSLKEGDPRRKEVGETIREKINAILSRE